MGRPAETRQGGAWRGEVASNNRNPNQRLGMTVEFFELVQIRFHNVQASSE